LVGHAYGDKPLLADDELDLEEEGKPVLLEHKGQAAYWFNNNSSSNVFDLAPFQRPRKDSLLGRSAQQPASLPCAPSAQWAAEEAPPPRLPRGVAKDLFGSSPFHVASTNPFQAAAEPAAHFFHIDDHTSTQLATGE
jgi:hypothetical protein